MELPDDPGPISGSRSAHSSTLPARPIRIHRIVLYTIGVVGMNQNRQLPRRRLCNRRLRHGRHHGKLHGIAVAGLVNAVAVRLRTPIGVSGFDNRVTLHEGTPLVGNSGKSIVVQQGS
jgi:Protein of unknown function (DUF3060)